MRVTVRTRGTERIQRRLERRAAALDSRVLLRVASRAAQEANRTQTPRRTGRLQRSMQLVVQGTTLVMRWTAPYARRVDARRMFTSRVLQRVREAVRQQLRRRA